MKEINLSSSAMSQGFVSRDAELLQLTKLLEKALAGETQVCFITGEAGSGKTTLIEEFAQRAEKLDKDLIFPLGTCNAQTGISDPYLPFRAVLRMLTGDTANEITHSNSNRLDSIFKTSGRVLVEVAPELVGTLIPGGSILMSLARMAAKEQGLLKSLEDRAKSVGRVPQDIEQSQIFLQFTALLRELSKEYPLVIILDDLQWVDDASNALFFHLVRELQNCRIFFIGLYRPNDVAMGRNHDRHPLQQTLNEIKRIYGDIWIDLDQVTQTDGRAFVEALIDSQPNGLSPAFREALYARTKGHALFTNELLRAMQERGDLIQDTEGRWQESSQLDWNTLPAKIEGIIEERIERLEDELREILNVACVQGQDFVAEVVAKIQNIQKRDLVKKLSRDLERCHRLIEDVGEVRLGKTKLWNYTFSHALFQVYLYNNLETPERQMYHAEVADTLEEIYADEAQTIAVQLAYHYTAAGESEKAATYLQVAGEQSCKLGEFLSARNSFNQALALGQSAPFRMDYANCAQLLWWIGETHYHIAEYGDAEKYYQQGLEVARKSGDPEIITRNLIGLAQSLRRQRMNQEAFIIVREALALAQKIGDRSQEAIALRVLGIVYGQMDQNKDRLTCYQKSLTIAKEINDINQQMSCLNNIGVVHSEVFGDFPKAIEYFDRALRIGRQHNNLPEQSAHLDNLANSYIRLGISKEAAAHINEQLVISNRYGNIQRTAASYDNLAIILMHQDKAEEAIENWVKAIQIADEHKRYETQVESRNRLVVAYLGIRQTESAWRIVEETRPLTQQYKAKTQVHSEIFLEGLTLLRLGRFQEARRALETARDHATQILHTGRWAYRYHRAFAQAGVALLAPPDRQDEYLTKAIKFFQEAVEMCGWVGVLDDALWVLREMQKADSEQLLEPIENYLAEKREIAWTNRPLIN